MTGNPRYVNNKSKLLRENGWEVIVLWSSNLSSVELDNVKVYDNKKFIHHELKFYPSWFSERQRNKVIERLVTVIGDADQIVVESNKLELGAWGEILAKRLHCKHINFVTTEGVSIKNQETFDYCYAKIKKNEFFNINSSSVTMFFSNFVVIDNPENHCFSASPGVEVKEYSFPVFDELPKADYTITHFGRSKCYFPKMLSELRTFLSCHSLKKFNIFFLGNLTNEDYVRNLLGLPNVHVAFHSEVKIIPKQVFEKSDVVIGTAGCASVASRYMSNVIAMDVMTNEPLGILKRTTFDSNVSSGKYMSNKSLSQWLNALLIDGVTYPLIDTRKVSHGYEYQMRFVDECDYQYIDTAKVKERITRHDDLYAFLVKIGLFHLVEYFFFKRRGVKIIWR